MAEIKLVRVDYRLIHGQVATVWSKEANAQRIIICSDEVAKDQIRKTGSGKMVKGLPSKTNRISR